jgi:hypothetical protein
VIKHVKRLLNQLRGLRRDSTRDPQIRRLGIGQALVRRILTGTG